MLLASFAPVVSQWLGSSRSGPSFWVEVCSSAGPKWVYVGAATHQLADVGGNSDEQQGDAHHAQQHCAFCNMQAHALGMPKAPEITVLQVATDRPPVLFLHAPKSFFAWSPSLARAPPAVS